MKQIEKRLGSYSSATSRNVQALSTRHSSGKGLSMVETISDPSDPRAKLVFLTPKGRRIWERMKQVVA